METDTVVIRTGLQELQRQLKFRKTMLERRKERVKESLAADEWKIRSLEAKVAERMKAEAK
jgi:Arc/MetJ-type ribon-helix-helix transcriptional regulator